MSSSHAIKRAVLSELARYPFRPDPWLRGPHRQTLWGPALRWPPPLPTRLEHWPTPDGDRLRLHVHGGRVDQPMALLLHGLEGSADAWYIRALGLALTAQGWGIVALDYRSCGGEMNHARRLYHLGETGDVDHVVRRMAERWPQRALCLAGFSMGANLVLKWLGEQGDAAPAQVVAAAAVSAPFDLTACAYHLHRGIGHGYVLNFMRTLIPKALAKERQYPGCVERERVKGCRSFFAYDACVTAPLHGFRDLGDYWKSCSCRHYLTGVRRPVLIISAADDPFTPPEVLPHALADRSPFLHNLFVPHGGHCGFVHVNGRGVEPWAQSQILRFLARYTDAEPRADAAPNVQVMAAGRAGVG